MRAIKLGLGLVTVLVFSIAMTASASAAEFLSSKPEALLAENVSTQVFKTDQGNVECGKVNILAGTTALKSTDQLALVDYENCKAFGAPAEISTAHYLFLANGEVHVLKLIHINVPLVGCLISVGIQKTNKVTYKTNGKNLLLEPEVSGISYTAASGCIPSGSATDGTYKGHLEVMIPNGTVSFDP